MTDNNLPTLDFNDAKIRQILKNSICPGATDEELLYFANVCKSTGLNPLKKEIWMIVQPAKSWKDRNTGEERKTERKVQIMTGIAGFFAIANDCPEYDGMETEVIWDDATKLPSSAIVKVHRKDRKFPCVAEALWDEYYKPNKYGNKGVWEEKPSIMLLKCAKALALREAFPQRLNGLYAQEEMPAEYGTPAEKLIAPVVDTGPYVDMSTADEPAPADPVITPVSKGQKWIYKIENATGKQLEFLEREGVLPGDEASTYVSPKKLGEKLDKYLVEVQHA